MCSICFIISFSVPNTRIHRIWKEKYLDDEDRREKARKEGKAEPAAPEKSGSFFGRRKDKH